LSAGHEAPRWSARECAAGGTSPGRAALLDGSLLSGEAAHDFGKARRCEAIADGYDTCAVTSVPAADVEGAVLAQVQNLLATPELVARTWAAAKREGDDDIPEREVTVLLADFATVWAELFPARAGADRPTPCRAGRREGGRSGGADLGCGAGQPGR
jgi:hypothetical protein